MEAAQEDKKGRVRLRPNLVAIITLVNFNHKSDRSFVPWPV